MSEAAGSFQPAGQAAKPIRGTGPFDSGDIDFG
jgi:hypothetical protein